ncbi:MAG: hypothetical protein KBD63_03365 [Bacteriovoracaceae bacterium]|nr:hypothetical protein [Bacteriovoracaceae bacterium]
MLYTLAFFGFAVFLSLRDVLSELFLKEAPIPMAFLICAVITLFSFGQLLITKKISSLQKNLKKKQVQKRAWALGILCAFIYALTFFMLKKIGAGLFNMINHGLTPLLTALIGITVFKNSFRLNFLLSLILYISGIFLLTWYRPFFGWEWIFLLLLCPLSLATSAGLMKWLLDPKLGGLSQAEVLFIRFAPATLFLFFWIYWHPALLFSYQNLSRAILISIIGGYLPLFLLCVALSRRSLTDLARWNLLVPAFTFFGTLYWHPENIKIIPIGGGVLVLLAMLINKPGEA